MSFIRQLVSLRQHDLNQLVALSALLQARSVTDAANRLGVSQPAMSKSLDKLRREFNDPLLVREGNEMRLTPKAQALLPLTDEALERLGLVFEAQGPFDPALARGQVRIAGNEHAQTLFGPRLLRRLRTQAPGIVLEFTYVGMPHPRHLLSERLVDIIIGVTIASAEDMRSQPLHKDEWVCVASASNTALPARLDLATFCAQPHLDVSPLGTGMLHVSLDHALSEIGGSRRVVASVSSYRSVPCMIAGTDLLAVVPRRLLEELPQGAIRKLSLEFDLPPFELLMWWHNSTQHDEKFRWLRQCVIDAAQPIS